MLELKLLGSGASQHVFVRADNDDDPWVYKTAAFIDELLPGHIRLYGLRPVRTLSRAVYTAAFTVPRHVWHAAGERIQAAPVHGSSLARAVRSCRAAYLQALSGLHTIHLRHARVRRFDHVLKLHARLAGSPAAEVLLPFRVRSRVRARLLLPARALQFEGAMIQQSRTDVFFDRIDDAQHCDPDALIRSQHSLWRCGFGIADGATAIGPFGWCRYRGTLRLADTGSLSTSFREVQRCLGDGADDAWRRRLARLEGQRLATARAYYAHVRPHLNVPALQHTWRVPAPDHTF